jgi:hypothetical protein
MPSDISRGTVRCATCGREYTGSVPRFCLTCGTSLADEIRGVASGVRADAAPPATGPPAKKRGHTLIIVAAVVVTLLVAGGVAAAVIGLGGGEKAQPLPTTVAEMKASVQSDQDYLNSHWKTLAPGRVKGAPVYSVSTKLDTANFTLSGTERVLYTNTTTSSMNEVVIRIYAKSAVVNPGGAGASVFNVTADGKATASAFSGSLLHVKLPALLGAGSEVLVQFDFSEAIPEIAGGLGGLEQMLGQSTGGGYGVFGHDSTVFDLGYFIPMVTTYGPTGWDKRDVPPIGDVSSYDCAYYNVALDVPSDYVVAAPGVAAGTSETGGRKVWSFRGGPMRDFSAQASAGYRVAKTTVGETTVCAYFLKDARDNGRKSLTYAASAIDAYNKQFGYYPYVGFNVCEAPLGGGAGGMEFAGQVQIAGLLYGSMSSLTGSDNSEISNLLNSLGGSLLGGMLEFTIAHEVCHQWWGLTVGSDSITHPWQDESLTNYCSVLYFRWAHGEDAAKKQLDEEVSLPWTAAKLLGSSGDMVVDTPVSGFSNETQYSAVIYSKGALFFQALEKQMGADAFARSLKLYYDGWAFRLASPADLMACFTANGSAEAIAALHRRWILETHADEDIASTVPGSDLLQDLMKDLPNGLDLNNLQDLLKELTPNGTTPQSPLLDNNEPVVPI